MVRVSIARKNLDKFINNLIYRIDHYYTKNEDFEGTNFKSYIENLKAEKEKYITYLINAVLEDMKDTKENNRIDNYKEAYLEGVTTVLNCIFDGKVTIKWTINKK